MLMRFFAVSLTLALMACASSNDGGARDGAVLVSADGLLTRGAAVRADRGFIYADKGCFPFALDGSKSLDLLGDPRQVVQSNDYIGAAIYAVSPGRHQLTVRSMISVAGMEREALPVTALTVQARHFYGIDCVHNGGTVDISVTERDHLGRRND